MFPACRALRCHRIPSPSFRSTRQLHLKSNSAIPPRQTRASAFTPRPNTYTRPVRSAIDPRTFLVAAAVSFVLVYAGAAFRAAPTEHTPSQQNPETEKQQGTTAQGAQDQDELAHDWPGLTMAPQPQPGRLGNLTPDQEVKLKEMWASTLDIFGVSHEEAHVNGATPSLNTPEKKKKKGLMGRFGKKNKDDDSTSSPEVNDKHGQVKEYEQALATMTPEQIREAFWGMIKHDHPDALLLRFLRARKWDVQAAQIMALSTLHWRLKDMHVDDDIMLKGEGHAVRETKSSNPAEKKEGEDLLAQLRMGKSFLHGIDKEGRPCCYVRARLHRQGEQSEQSLERFTVYTIETARMLLRPPVDTATIVFDLTDFSMANMDYTPVKFMIKCFEANYPESLGSVIVYKSPWIFHGIWKIIKGWLDPVVASKVHFASNVENLEEWIPRSNIMKELGGDEDWTYKYTEPQEAEDVVMAETGEREKILEERKELVKSFESETEGWVNGDGGEGRNRLAQRLAENYWRLDPYIRARSLYDRSGVIQPLGKLDFYPERDVKPAAAPAAAAPAAAATGGREEDLD